MKLQKSSELEKTAIDSPVGATGEKMPLELRNYVLDKHISKVSVEEEKSAVGSLEHPIPKQKSPLPTLKQEFNLLNLYHLKPSKQLEILKSIRDKILFLFALCELVKSGTVKQDLPSLLKNLPKTTKDKQELGLRRLLSETIAKNGDYSTAVQISEEWNLQNTRRLLSISLMNSSGEKLEHCIDQLIYTNEKLTCKELIYTLLNLDTSNDHYKNLFMDAISRFPSNGQVAKIVTDAFLNINGSGRELTMKLAMLMDKKVLESESLQVYILKIMYNGSGEEIEKSEDPMEKINLLSHWARMGIKVSPQALVCAAEGKWKSASLGLEFIKRNLDVGSDTSYPIRNHPRITQKLINMLLLSSHSECSLTAYDTLLHFQLQKSSVVSLRNLKNFAKVAIDRNSTSRIEYLVKITNSHAYDDIRDKFIHFVFREMTRVNTLPAGVIEVYEVCTENVKSNPGIIFFMLLSLRSRADLEYLHKVILLVRGRIKGHTGVNLVEQVFGPWLEGFGGDEELKTLVKEILMDDL